VILTDTKLLASLYKVTKHSNVDLYYKRLDNWQWYSEPWNNFKVGNGYEFKLMNSGQYNA
jgi:hypoxanthine phosphoribosyltransferase